VAEFELRAIQGNVAPATLTLDADTFAGTETLTASVGVGDGQAARLTLTPTWTAGQTTGAYSQVDVELSAAQTLALPWGVYNVQVGISGGDAALAYGWLTVYPGPGGTATPFWRSLASPALAVAYLPSLTQDQQDILPHALTAATRSIEAYCGRPLVLDAYDHFVRVQNTNRLRLRARPVVELTRVSSGTAAAIRVQNTAATAATVNVVRSSSGALGVTSLVFASTIGGATTSQTITLASHGTITLLAAAINALGNGWSAAANDGYGDYGSAEIFGSPGAMDARNGWAELLVGGAPLGGYHLDADGGIVEVNSSFSGGGLVGSHRDRGDSRNSGIRVTYRAGYAYLKADSDLGYYTVPEDLELATVMTASAMIESSATVGSVKAQWVKDRKVEYADVQVSIPAQAREMLARYAEPVF
jgi:hypothetical protein